MITPSLEDEFRQALRQTLAAVPAGRVVTYGQLAALAGHPRGGRLAGSFLASLPSGHGLPWHRVVNARGRLSFTPGTDAYRRQRRLLEAEGLVFDGERLSLAGYRWQA